MRFTEEAKRPEKDALAVPSEQPTGRPFGGGLLAVGASVGILDKTGRKARCFAPGVEDTLPQIGC